MTGYRANPDANPDPYGEERYERIAGEIAANRPFANAAGGAVPQRSNRSDRKRSGRLAGEPPGWGRWYAAGTREVFGAVQIDALDSGSEPRTSTSGHGLASLSVTP